MTLPATIACLTRFSLVINLKNDQLSLRRVLINLNANIRAR